MVSITRGVTATQPHFIVATGLIWLVATVIMCHSSDGRLQRQRPVNPVATGESLRQLHPSLLRVQVSYLFTEQ
jgi:hypothetical protein